MRRVWGCACLLVAIGCGQVANKTDANTNGSGDAGPDVNDGAKSGTRAKLQFRDYGGTRTLSGLFDAQRNERCYVSDWSDGSSYCVPADSTQTVYSNAQCTQAVGQVYHDPNCTPTAPAYLVQYDYAGCTQLAKHIYQRGPKIAVTQYYEHSVDGSCAGPYSTANYDFYQAGTEVAVSALIQFTRQAPEGSNRLAQRF